MHAKVTASFHLVEKNKEQTPQKRLGTSGVLDCAEKDLETVEMANCCGNA